MQARRHPSACSFQNYLCVCRDVFGPWLNTAGMAYSYSGKSEKAENATVVRSALCPVAASIIKILQAEVAGQLGGIESDTLEVVCTLCLALSYLSL